MTLYNRRLTQSRNGLAECFRLLSNMQMCIEGLTAAHCQLSAESYQRKTSKPLWVKKAFICSGILNWWLLTPCFCKQLWVQSLTSGALPRCWVSTMRLINVSGWLLSWKQKRGRQRWTESHCHWEHSRSILTLEYSKVLSIPTKHRNLSIYEHCMCETIQARLERHGNLCQKFLTNALSHPEFKSCG